MCEGTSSRFAVYLWELPTNDVLQTIVCEHLFANDESEMNSFLRDQIRKLEKIRGAYSHTFTNDGFKAGELLQFQPIFIMFLSQLIAATHQPFDVASAQSILLKGKLEVLGKNGTIVTKEISGYTDIIVTPKVAGKNSAAAVALCQMKGTPVEEFHIEIKSAFRSLYQKPADAQKDQVLAQSEAISQMCCGRFN
jgi:hypothetical protein